MPGPVSDSYDPEQGTADGVNTSREQLEEALREVYDKISLIIRKRPIDIRKIINNREDISKNIPQVETPLSEYDWRIIRFALERAGDSI